jgi:protein TonB
MKLVPPKYPPLASKAHVQGKVVLEATLKEDGTVDAIKVISGHPLLVNAAIDCVKLWRYEPSLLNGQPVAVILTAIVTFNQSPLSD